MLADAGFGWRIETGVHALRIVLGGVFDQFTFDRLPVAPADRERIAHGNAEALFGFPPQPSPATYGRTIFAGSTIRSKSPSPT